MDIFDEMGKRLGNVGQRTKDAAESARLNSLVSEQEKKIKTICQELGKLYLSLHGPEDCEPALADYVKEAGECYQKIADLREKIRVLKGLRQCPHCGSQIPAGTAYCGSCGKRVDEAPIQEDNAKRCGVCGSILREGLMFCTSCGAPVLAAEAAVARRQEFSVPSPAGQSARFPEQEPWPRPVPPMPEGPAEESDAPAGPDSWREPFAPMPEGPAEDPVSPPLQMPDCCPDCGRPLKPGAKFCSGCGKKL